MRYSLKRDCGLRLEAIRFDGVSKTTSPDQRILLCCLFRTIAIKTSENIRLKVSDIFDLAKNPEKGVDIKKNLLEMLS